MPRKLDPTLLHAITPPAFDRTKVHRAGLVDRIHASLDRSLVVIAAPAGYGKTTLLSDLTAHTDLKVCWVRIVGETVDAVSLAQLIALSLQKKFRKAARFATPRYSAGASPESTARVLASWIEEAASESFCLVIDDIHLLGQHNGAVPFIDELVRLRPSSLTVMACGREVPDFSLARLLAEGELVGFGPHDLAFSRAEVVELMERLSGGEVKAKEVERIYDLTKGWVTGVVLSQVVPSDGVARVTPDSSPLVYDYLSSVVLNRLPEELRRFALEASVLPVMTPSLCDALLQRDDCSRLLRQLVRRGAFIDVTEGDSPSYSFHGLFRSFLEVTFSAVDNQRQMRLRARAASILERGGSPDLAFRLLMDAGDRVRACSLADSHAREMWLLGRIELLEAWYEALRPDSGRVPELLLSLATAHMDRGDVKRAEELSTQVVVPAGKDSSTQYSLRLANLQSGICFQKGEYDECIAYAERVISSSEASSRPETLAIALETKARALAAKRAHLDEAKHLANAAVELMSDLGDYRARARALTNLGVVLETAGEHRNAATIFEKASLLLKEVGSPIDLAYGLNNLAHARHKKGEFEGALETYAEALKQARQAAHPYLEALVLFGEADVFTDVGMAMQAAQLYAEGLAIAARIDHRFLLEYGCLQTSVLYRRRGNAAVSNEWVRRVFEQERNGTRSSATAVQLAALESTAAPRNAISSIKRIFRDNSQGLSGEDEILAGIVLARAFSVLGDVKRCRETVQGVLTRVAANGAEQAIASELLADGALREMIQSMAPDDPVLEIVAGRIDAMEAFRRLHRTPAEREVEGTKVRIDALGSSRILHEGKLIRGLKRQAREVLYYLVDRKSSGRESIGEAFWPDLPPGRRAANIHTAIHSIRTLLGKASILLEEGVYSLNPNVQILYDVDQFEGAANIAERLTSGDPRRFFALTEAISLYSGPFLSETSSQWVTERRRSLEARYLDLVGQLAAEALIKDQPQRALDYLRRGLAIDPLRDDFNLHYMEALGRLGQISQVSQHYQHYISLVRQELGIDPPAEIRELYSRLIG